MKTSTLISLLVLLLSPAAGLADDPDNGTRPPAGISATTVTLAELRSAHARAIATETLATYKAHWSVTHGSDTATMNEAVRGSDFRLDTTAHGTHSASGMLGDRSWTQNENGEVVFAHGVHQSTRIDRSAERTLDPRSAQLLGEAAQPQPSYVVRIDPPGGRLEYVYYDATTYGIIRREEAIEGTRVITTFDGFKPFGAASVATHIRRYVTSTDDTTDRTLLSFDPNAPVTDADLAIPAQSNPLSFTSPAKIPATFLSDRIVVHVRIQGRPVNLLLDSGASGIVIDRSVLEALRIPLFDEREAATAGKYQLGQAVVPLVEIGDASLRNVFVDAAPITMVMSDDTIVGGLLGFDFLAGAVVKIDYVNKTVALFDPVTFTAPAGAYAENIDLEDQQPMLAATLGGANVPHFIMDTGADRSTLFSAYVDAHPENTRDQGLGTEQRDAYPFEQRFLGVGGTVVYQMLELGPFGFAGETFPRWLFQATQHAASFEQEDVDGLVGQDALRYFDVYLDYPHEKAYFVPNQRYHDRFG